MRCAPCRIIPSSGSIVEKRRKRNKYAAVRRNISRAIHRSLRCDSGMKMDLFGASPVDTTASLTHGGKIRGQTGKKGSDPSRETGVIVDTVRHAPREGSDPFFP